MAKRNQRKRRNRAPHATPDTEAGPAVRPITIGFSRRRFLLILLCVCFAAEISFWVLDYFINYKDITDVGQFQRMFNGTREDSIGSWFCITQTFLVSLTCFALYIVARTAAFPRWRRVGWLVLAVFFFYMSADDGAKIHERVGSAFKEAQEEKMEDSDEDPTLGTVALNVFPSYPWQILFVPFFGGMGIFLLIFTWKELQGRGRWLCIAGGIGLFTVSVCLDFVEGLDEDHPWNAYTHVVKAYPDLEIFTMNEFKREAFRSLRHFSKTTEESLEMAGMTLIWIAFLGHLMSEAKHLRIHFLDPGESL